MSHDPNSPVLIELDDQAKAPPIPAEAPSVAEDAAAPSGQAMQTMAALATRRRSRLAAWFWRLALTLIVFLASLAAWDLVTGLIARHPLLGGAAMLLIAVFVTVCLLILIRELAALGRLRKVEHLQNEAASVESGELQDARAFAQKLASFYGGREDTRWGREKLLEGAAEAFEPRTILLLAEDTVLKPLDDQATKEIEAAARQVATITALVPMAFADVLAALTSNLRMIRRIAEIYGGRSGTLGAWRLTRAVITHLVATGAVAVGDDLIGSIGGGHLLGKISRRFGEGLVNGALTARVGVAAMEVCRPVPFSKEKRPGVTALVRRALTGFLASADK